MGRIRVDRGEAVMPNPIDEGYLRIPFAVLPLVTIVRLVREVEAEGLL
jgi:hypothetical protein